MKCLSVRQPWATLLALGLKDVENRDWYTSYCGPLLIHAGKQFEDEAVGWILQRLDDIERKKFPMQKSAFPLGGIVGCVRMVDCVTDSESKWFVGDYGFVFDKAIELPFMPMPGRLGLFNAPTEIVARVRAEIEQRKARV